jgi:hypothetical protein
MATTGSHYGQMAREGGPKSRCPRALRQMGLQAVYLDRFVLSLLYTLSLLKTQLSFRILYLSLDTIG